LSKIIQKRKRKNRTVTGQKLQFKEKGENINIEVYTHKKKEQQKEGKNKKNYIHNWRRPKKCYHIKEKRKKTEGNIEKIERKIS
jgi:hypothetical protein